eukprot:1352096-Rhodomonas_salina.1
MSARRSGARARAGLDEEEVVEAHPVVPLVEVFLRQRPSVVLALRDLLLHVRWHVLCVPRDPVVAVLAPARSRVT